MSWIPIENVTLKSDVPFSLGAVQLLPQLGWTLAPVNLWPASLTRAVTFDVTGPGLRHQTPGDPQQVGFPCQMLFGAVWLPPICPCFLLSISLEQLWDFSRWLCKRQLRDAHKISMLATPTKLKWLLHLCKVCEKIPPPKYVVMLTILPYVRHPFYCVFVPFFIWYNSFCTCRVLTFTFVWSSTTK